MWLGLDFLPDLCHAIWVMSAMACQGDLFMKLAFNTHADAVRELMSNGFRKVERYSNRNQLSEIYFKGNKFVLVDGKYVPYEGYKVYLKPVS